MGLDVVSLGEVLVDFLPDRRGRRVRDVKRWLPCLGGAPANVAVGLSRLGAKSALVSVTGADEFGALVKQGLEAEGVDVRFVRQTSQGKTGLGFVSLTTTGERSFVFYRQRSAESFLDGRDMARASRAIASARVVHAGTNALQQQPARAAVLDAIARSFAAGQITSCDPNLRLHVWPEPSVLRRLLDQLLPRCAVVKLSEEEIGFVVDARTVEGALLKLEARGVALAIVTRGRQGAVFRFQGQTRTVRAPRVVVRDTTGAGDGFMAGLLFGVTRCCRTRAELEALDVDAMEDLVRFGCVVGSEVVQKLGAVAGLPTRARVASALPRALRRR